MHCKLCMSANVLPLKDGEFTTGTFCNNCGIGSVDYNYDTCCGNPCLVNVRFEQSNGVFVQRTACKNCKSLISGAVKKDNDFNTYQLYSQQRFKEIQQLKNDSVIRLREYINLLTENFRNKKSAEWWSKYELYLKTDTWKKKRAAVIKRESNICQGCKVSKIDHVHHTTYENLYDELLFQLIGLCQPCHSKLHPEKTLL